MSQPDQEQIQPPGTEAEMTPQADHGETSYRGCDRLTGRVAVLNDPKCRRRYAALRARGHSYGRALRGVADRLLGVACVLLQRQVLFDPDHGTLTAPQARAIP